MMDNKEDKTIIDQRNLDAETAIEKIALKVKRYTRYYENGIVYKRLSFIPNIVSIATSFFGAFFLVQSLESFGKIGIIGMAVLILPMIEYLKRLLLEFIGNGAYDKTEQISIAHLVFMAMLVGVSISISFFGGDRATKFFSPPPPMASDSRIDSLDALIDSARVDIKHNEKQTYAGRMVKDARKSKLLNQQTIAALSVEKGLILSENKKEYNKLVANHNAGVTQLGLVIGVTSGSMDILLIILYLAFKKNIQTAIRLKRSTATPTRSKATRGGSKPVDQPVEKDDQLKNRFSEEVEKKGSNSDQPVDWGLVALNLRQSDPGHWTLKRLGDHFGVTPQAVSKKLKKLDNVRTMKRRPA